MDKNLLKEALEIGLDAAREIADETHAKYAGYKPNRHVAVDANVKKLEDALAMLDAMDVLTVDEESVRLDFESWCWNEGPWSPNFATERNTLGDYASMQTDGAWHAWLHFAKQLHDIKMLDDWSVVTTNRPPEGAEVLTFNPKHQKVLELNPYWRSYDAYDAETERGATHWRPWPKLPNLTNK